MLRIGNTEVRPGHRGELRIIVAAARPGGPRPAEPGQLRAYLLADLARRYAERSGLAPTVVDVAPRAEKPLRAACDALNIHPPRHTLTGTAAADSQLAGWFHDGAREPVFDIGVRLEGQRPDEALAPHWITVPANAGDVDLGEEPLAVRMKMLGIAGDPVLILRRWRERVATWAKSPSGAMSRPHAEAIATAFSGDLDAAAALRVLTDLEADESVPDGVKFETFAAADRMFGLDLARDVGRA